MAMNLVKFTRGTPSAFQKLQTIDKDTLYFISEKDASTGILYLGNKIIAGGSTGNSVTSLKDLTDVLLENHIDDEALLVYDGEAKAWVSKSLSEILDSVIFQGASETEAGVAGYVPAPAAGDQDAFLKGDGTWSHEVSDLQTAFETLVGDDEGKSVQEIAEDVFSGYVGNIDALKDVMDWIDNNPDFVDFSGQLNKLEAAVFDTGTPGTGTFQAGLLTTVGSLSSNMTTVLSEIDDINDRLTWHELT